MDCKRNIYFLLVILFLLSSCTVHMTNLLIDPGFTAESLRQKGVIWTPITSQNKRWTTKQKKQFSKIAKDSITHRRTDFSLHNPDGIIRKLGKTKFDHILYEFAYNGQVQAQSLVKIQHAAGKTRYIMFSRITQDNIQQHQKTENEKVDGKQHYYIVYETVREITVHSQLYDLTTLKMVWSGEITKKKTKTNRNPHYQGNSRIKDIAHRITEDTVFGTYPDPEPLLRKMIKRVFSGIAGNLPREK